MLVTQDVAGNVLNKLVNMADFEEMKNAYLRALDPNTYELQKENERLKAELDALRTKYNRVLTTLQDSVELVLRVAREGKAET